MKYRDRNEITAQILDSANGSRVRLTKIMFDGYLSHTATFNRKGADRISGWRKNIQDYRKGMKFLRIHDRVEKLNPVAPGLHSNVEKV